MDYALSGDREPDYRLPTPVRDNAGQERRHPVTAEKPEPQTGDDQEEAKLTLIALEKELQYADSRLRELLKFRQEAANAVKDLSSRLGLDRHDGEKPKLGSSISNPELGRPKGNKGKGHVKQPPHSTPRHPR